MRKGNIGTLLLFAAVAMFAVGICGQAYAAAKYEWKVAHVLAPDHPWTVALKKFAEELKTRSNGEINLTIFPSGQMGQEREAIESLQMGVLEFTIVSSATLANFTTSLNILDLHYLMPGVKCGRAVVDSEIGRQLLDTLDAIQIHGIDFWENGMYSIYGNVRVQHPADIKGLKIRVNDNQFHIETYKALDANPVHIPWGDIYTSLEQGVCDLSTTTFVNQHSAKHDEASKFFIKANQLYTVAPLLMSKAVWDPLSDDIKKVIMDSSKAAMTYERQLMDEANAQIDEEIKAAGKEIVEVDTKEWRAAIQSVYDAHIGKDIDKDLYEAITAVVEKNQ